MSSDAGNPFQQLGSARPAQPSVVPKVIAVVVALFLVLILGIVAAKVIGSRGIRTGLAEGLHAGKENAIPVDDSVLWGDYADDGEEADKKYKGRWVIVKGKCSAEVIPSRPDGSAINEQYSIQVGLRQRQLGDEWLIDCNIPRQHVAKFNKQIKLGGTASILGVVKGRNNNTNQVELKDCELVSFSPE